MTKSKTTYPLPPFPALNWKEIAQLSKSLHSRLKGLHVRKVLVPARPEFPDGFLKSEWALQLGSRDTDFHWVFSVRPQRPYLLAIENRKIKSATQGTRSGFDLALDKHFYGVKIKAVEAFHQERWVAIWMEGELGLILKLIPAQPEAFLVVKAGEKLNVIARSGQNTGKELETSECLEIPDGLKAPLDIEYRGEWVASSTDYSNVVEKWLGQEAIFLRHQRARRILSESMKVVKARARQSEVSLAEAKKEAPWDFYGTLLKSSLHQVSGKSKTLTLKDYSDFDPETGEPKTVEIPCDPKLTPAMQVEKFFSLARRKERRLSEAQSRLAGFQDQLQRFSETESLLENPPLTPELMTKVEVKLGLSSGLEKSSAHQDKSRSRIALSGWTGRIFTSSDGFPIWVGKSKDENLELTFKLARGNDIWMHVRGRPGAHTVVPTVAGKSVPLETLLDAAVLTVFYSGGENWGKTEVDYTYKKFVKRIKDSTEASYTGNKTLMVEPQGERLQRLLSVLKT